MIAIIGALQGVLERLPSGLCNIHYIAEGSRMNA